MAENQVEVQKKNYIEITGLLQKQVINKINDYVKKEQKKSTEMEKLASSKASSSKLNSLKVGLGFDKTFDLIKGNLSKIINSLDTATFEKDEKSYYSWLKTAFNKISTETADQQNKSIQAKAKATSTANTLNWWILNQITDAVIFLAEWARSQGSKKERAKINEAQKAMDKLKKEVESHDTFIAGDVKNRLGLSQEDKILSKKTVGAVKNKVVGKTRDVLGLNPGDKINSKKGAKRALSLGFGLAVHAMGAFFDAPALNMAASSYMGSRRAKIEQEKAVFENLQKSKKEQTKALRDSLKEKRKLAKENLFEAALLKQDQEFNDYKVSKNSGLKSGLEISEFNANMQRAARSNKKHIKLKTGANLNARVAAAGGGSFITKGPTNFTVGDNPGGVERVSVEPISGKGTTRTRGAIKAAGGGEFNIGGDTSKKSSGLKSLSLLNKAFGGSNEKVVDAVSEVETKLDQIYQDQKRFHDYQISSDADNSLNKSTRISRDGAIGSKEESKEIKKEEKKGLLDGLLGKLGLPALSGKTLLKGGMGLAGAAGGGYLGYKGGGWLANKFGMEEGGTGETAMKWGGAALGGVGGAYGMSKLASKIPGGGMLGKLAGASGMNGTPVYVTNADEIKGDGGLGDLLPGGGGSKGGGKMGALSKILGNKWVQRGGATALAAGVGYMGYKGAQHVLGTGEEAGNKVVGKNADGSDQLAKDTTSFKVKEAAAKGTGILSGYGGFKAGSALMNKGATWAAAKATSAAAGAGEAAAASGGLLSKMAPALKFLGPAARVMGKVALPLQAAMSAVDAYKGWKNADSIAGTEPGKASLLQKTGASVANVASGLTFGLVKPQTMYKAFEGMAQLSPAGMLYKGWKFMADTDKRRAANEDKNKKLIENGNAKSDEEKSLKDKLTDIFDDPDKSLMSKIGSGFGAFKDSAVGGAKSAWDTISQPFRGKFDTSKLKGGVGAVAAQFESGGAGAGTISSGAGDHGGKSYGTHQLSSKQGKVQDFLKSSGYGNQFSGLQVGSAEFDAKWKQTAANDPNFEKAQHDYIAKTHAAPQLAKLEKLGLDTKNRAIQELAFSTGVQYGPGTNVIVDAIKASGKDPKSLSTKDIINIVQDYKAGTTGKYFKSSSSGVQAGVAKRHNGGERQALLATADFADQERGKEKASEPAPAAKKQGFFAKLFGPKDAVAATIPTAGVDSAKKDQPPAPAPAPAPKKAPKKAIVKAPVQQSGGGQKASAAKPNLTMAPMPSSGASASDFNQDTTSGIEAAHSLQSSGVLPAIQEAKFGGPVQGAMATGGSIAEKDQKLVITGKPTDFMQFYNTGGESRYKGLNPALQQRLYDMSKEYYQKTGQKVQITSLYRPADQQAQLYAQNVAAHPPNGDGKVAKPGRSMHEQGFAVDFNPAIQQASKLANVGGENLLAKYGFHRPLWPSSPSGRVKEEWHAEGVETATKGFKEALWNKTPVPQVASRSAAPSGGGGGGSTEAIEQTSKGTISDQPAVPVKSASRISMAPTTSASSVGITPSTGSVASSTVKLASMPTGSQSSADLVKSTTQQAYGMAPTTDLIKSTSDNERKMASNVNKAANATNNMVQNVINSTKGTNNSPIVINTGDTSSFATFLMRKYALGA